MIVKHIGADGRVRRTFENINRIGQQHAGNNVVAVMRQIAYLQTGGVITTVSINESPTAPPLRYWDTEYTVALINLAPGESLERVDDEPDRR
jgi:hypothetical protein